MMTSEEIRAARWRHPATMEQAAGAADTETALGHIVALNKELELLRQAIMNAGSSSDFDEPGEAAA